jgi:hypothetical protein
MPADASPERSGRLVRLRTIIRTAGDSSGVMPMRSSSVRRNAGTSGVIATIGGIVTTRRSVPSAPAVAANTATAAPPNATAGSSSSTSAGKRKNWA